MAGGDVQSVLVLPTTSIQDTIRVMDRGAMAIALVVDGQGCLMGTVTDGDVRRGLLRGLPLTTPIAEIMHGDPVTAPQGSSRDTLLALMQQHQVEHLPVTDESGRVVGLQLLSDFIDQPREKENLVIVFAGGLGTRLKPLTDHTPKPLLKVGARSLLDWLIAQIASYGFRQFLIAVHHQAEALERQLGTGEHAGVHIQYLRESAPLGTVGAVRLAESQLDRPFIVVNGDLLTKVNFEHLLEYHEQRHFDVTMAVKPYEARIPYGVVQLADGEVIDLEEKPSRTYLANAGIYVLSPSVLKLIPASTRYDMTDLIRDALQAKLRVGGFPIHEYWLDVGRHADYAAAQEEAKQWVAP
ncbi:MAG: nucleotidyltransferase family protein [Candidatus Omnitrophica bacterium]|nr:nucleotidyltransferase family protein [Candidatus Omnitrophota bacterium]